MMKISTFLNDASQNAHNTKKKDFVPGSLAVKMLISYSKALQILQCSDFKTCYIVLN
jgi:hypothetical protein